MTDWIFLRCSPRPARCGGALARPTTPLRTRISTPSRIPAGRAKWPTISINWDNWREVGMAVNTLRPARGGVKPRQLRVDLPPKKEFARSRGAPARHPQVIVRAARQRQRRRRWSGERRRPAAEGARGSWRRRSPRRSATRVRPAQPHPGPRRNWRRADRVVDRSADDFADRPRRQLLRTRRPFASRASVAAENPREIPDCPRAARIVRRSDRGLAQCAIHDKLVSEIADQDAPTGAASPMSRRSIRDKADRRGCSGRTGSLPPRRDGAA